MLTSGVRRGSLAALAVMLLALIGFTGGTAMVQAQAQTLDGGTTTLTPGQGASPQEELLAEALGALVEAGYNPADFDFERAAFDPQGRAVFLPVRVTDEIERRAQAFVQNQQRFLLIGVLYARQPFEFQGKRYGRGLHPVVLENRAASLDPKGRKSAARVFNGNEGPGYDGGSCNNIQGENNTCVTVVFNGPTGSGTYEVRVEPPPPPTPGKGKEGACAAAGGAAGAIAKHSVGLALVAVTAAIHLRHLRIAG